MHAHPLRILLIHCNRHRSELIDSSLCKAGMRFQIHRVESEAALDTALGTARLPPDIILCDFQPMGIEGTAALSISQKLCPEVPFIFISDRQHEDVALDCVNRGARDYVLTDNLTRLPHAVNRAHREARERTARLHAVRALRESEERNRILSRLVEQTGDCVVSTDRDGVVRSWNRAAATLLEFPSEDAVGRSLRSLHLAHLSEAQYAEVLARIRSHDAYTRETEVRTRGGNRLYIVSSHTPLYDDAGSHIGQMTIARDITALKRHDERIARLSRIGRFSQSVNAAIIRRYEIDRLFAEICRAASEIGEFPIAWIATIDRSSGTVEQVASAGLDAVLRMQHPGRFALSQVSSPGTAGAVLSVRRIVVDKDITARAGIGYARREAVRRGCRSMVTMPLMVDSEVVAIMTLYAQESDFFDNEELARLERLAEQMSIALDQYRLEGRFDPAWNCTTAANPSQFLLFGTSEMPGELMR